MARPATYTVSDGKLTLFLRDAGDGWFAVTSPLDPELHTQAKSLAEAFEMAHDARKALASARIGRSRCLSYLRPQSQIN